VVMRWVKGEGKLGSGAAEAPTPNSGLGEPKSLLPVYPFHLFGRVSLDRARTPCTLNSFTNIKRICKTAPATNPPNVLSLSLLPTSSCNLVFY
jgi:hypothetical protein